MAFCHEQLGLPSGDALAPHGFALLDRKRRQVFGGKDRHVSRTPGVDVDLRDGACVLRLGVVDLH
ncbi:hypothetical protein FQZ97_1213700 [compost metagenome]